MFPAYGTTNNIAYDIAYGTTNNIAYDIANDIANDTACLCNCLRH
jgi:hypothetical protein